MKQTEFKQLIQSGGLSRYSELYTDISAETDRLLKATDSYAETFGDGDISVFSVPGRSEIIGNHTDHNGGKVMAGAITRDIIAIASPNSDGVIRYRSEGYAEDAIRLCDVGNPEKFRKFTSRALVAGMAGGFIRNGYKVGGFNVYLTTKVLKGSGLSSSAAFEVMIGNILNHLYNGGEVDNTEIAKVAQYSENVYFGKPCGLMDQMACAVGSFVYIDFKDRDDPRVEPVEFSLSDRGYALCIVNTGGSHASLNDDYASVPAEMKGAAAVCGRELLAGLTEEELLAKADRIRSTLGDRALLRAIHFIRECHRVDGAKSALKRGDMDSFLAFIRASGASSFRYLQNVYTNKAPEEQGISLALALSEGYLEDKCGAWRVHGGGFAGTVQAFVRREDLAGYTELMESVFGKGSVDVLGIRPLGATKLF